MKWYFWLALVVGVLTIGFFGFRMFRKNKKDKIAATEKEAEAGGGDVEEPVDKGGGEVETPAEKMRVAI